MIESQVLIKEIAAAASDKKAKDILIMDMQRVSPVTDYFIVCSASSAVQVKAIADNIDEKLSEQGVEPLSKEGYREGRWILIDYGTCVVHIFLEEERLFYNLEQLWGDAEMHLYKE